MAKTLHEQIQIVQEEIRQKENRCRELIQKQKEADRKARTKRLIERGAIAESLIDGADTLTNEQFQTIISHALSTSTVHEIIQSMHQHNISETQKVEENTTERTE